MKLIFLPVIVAIILTFTVTGEELIAKYQPRIDVLKDIDVCDSTAKERLIFMVNIGYVKPSDSLYGFDLAIRYNPTKIRIVNFLTGNTLSSIFEEKSFSYGLDSGIISGFALTMKFNIKPSYGDSILIAFSAEWIGNCEDTTNLELLELNFTEEFKKDLDSVLGKGVVQGYPFPLPERSAKLKVDKQAIELKDKENAFKLNYSVSLPLPYYTESLILEYSGRDIIKIEDAVSDNKDAEVLGVEENKIALRLKNNITKFNLTLNCNYLPNDTISGYKFYIENLVYSDCSCILYSTADSVSIDKDSTYVSLNENSYDMLRYETDMIILNNTNYDVEKVVLFDLLGRELAEIDTKDKTEIKIFTKDLRNGIFLLGIYRKDNFEIKKFYKCY